MAGLRLRPDVTIIDPAVAESHIELDQIKTGYRATCDLRGQAAHRHVLLGYPGQAARHLKTHDVVLSIGAGAIILNSNREEI